MDFLSGWSSATRLVLKEGAKSNKTEVKSYGKGLGKELWFVHIGIDDNDEGKGIGLEQDSEWSMCISGILMGVTKGLKHPSEVVSTSEIKWSVELGSALPKRKMFSWKTTSLEMKMFLVLKSSTLYPLTPKGYPKKTHFLALGANLDLLCKRVEV